MYGLYTGFLLVGLFLFAFLIVLFQQTLSILCKGQKHFAFVKHLTLFNVDYKTLAAYALIKID